MSLFQGHLHSMLFLRGGMIVSRPSSHDGYPYPMFYKTGVMTPSQVPPYSIIILQRGEMSPSNGYSRIMILQGARYPSQGHPYPTMRVMDRLLTGGYPPLVPGTHHAVPFLLCRCAQEIGKARLS
jgi:hypothetical protein